MPGNYPEESIQHSERGESFEIKKVVFVNFNGLSYHLTGGTDKNITQSQMPTYKFLLKPIP
jgi:hypothetical protein